MIVGTVGLEVLALVALVLTVTRTAAGSDADARDRVARLVLVGIALQSLHFAEEYVTRFYERFPELRGLPAWSGDFFVTFNTLWLAVWVLAVLGLRRNVRVAFFPVWFFTLASLGNGVFHPACAIAVRGYFPGLFTSPLVGIVGVLLWSRLWALTHHTSD